MKRATCTILVLCILLAGCSVTTPSSPVLQPTALSPAVEAAVREAIRFRTEFGLRADDAYVRHLANDPTAVVGFGIPMLPGELAELRARISTADGITEAVDAYAATVPDVFGGQYIDSTTGTVYALFTDDLAVHRAALGKVLHPSAPLELLPARYSERALKAVMELLAPNRAWFEGIGAPIAGASLETSANRVWLMVSGDPPRGFDQIYERLGVPQDMVRITVEDRSLEKLPRGALRGQIVNALGLKVRGVFDVRVIGDRGSYEPDGGVGISTESDGSFFIERLAEMGWTIEIIDFSTGRVIGSAHAVVVGGETANITVRVDP